MGQVITTIDATDTLSTSRGEINTNFATLRSNFSGTTTPSSPVEGQWHTDTDDDSLKIYNGSSWTTIGNYTQPALGHLPVSAGSGYPLSGDLHLGAKKIKNVGAPSASTDAATKGYVDTQEAAHLHTGADGSNQITFTDLIAAAETGAWQVLQADDNDDIVARWFNNTDTAGTIAVAGSYVDLATSGSITCSANETKIIMCGCLAHGLYSAPNVCLPMYQILRDSTVISGPHTVPLEITATLYNQHVFITYAYTDTAPSGTSYTYKLQGKYDTAPAGTEYWRQRWITVL